MFLHTGYKTMKEPVSFFGGHLAERFFYEKVFENYMIWSLYLEYFPEEHKWIHLFQLLGDKLDEITD